MRKLLFSFVGLFATVQLFSQNVGIGTVTPAVKLDVKSTTNTPAQFNGTAPMYIGLFEADVYKGYLGSYSGAADDIDFGTGAGNGSGKLHLTIQASPRLTINTSGQVGIGTTNPAHQLHITGGDLFVESSIGKIIFGYNSGGSQWRLGTTGGGADLRWYSFDGVTETARHYFSQNGNVGIGTGIPTPVARLDVRVTGSNTLINAAEASSDIGLSMSLIGTSPTFGFNQMYSGGYKFMGNGYAGMFQYSTTTGDLNFYTSNATGFGISTSTPTAKMHVNGNMVIGSSLISPATGYQLSVDGKIISEELKVQLSGSWPDYVFGENYKLMPLDDLENSIRQNKHLPNIPSAADITAEKGFEVGDISKRLLEKIEELTLYIIQLKKENTRLEERLNQVEKKVGNAQ
jgi:hypothetical protein